MARAAKVNGDCFSGKGLASMHARFGRSRNRASCVSIAPNVQRRQPPTREALARRRRARWFACEKLDGCRGYWDGGRMFSRSGRVIQIPREWSAALPRMHLDGEFWAGRGKWERTVAAVVRNAWAPQVCFIVFD